MSKVGDYFFEFPASRGLQGSTVTYMMTVPARTLARVLASDNVGSTLERSQREINPTRVKKFYQYLVSAYKKKEPFIIPPLVGNCNSEIEFQEFGNTNVGVARFPMDAEIKLFDGQHRAAGIAEFCRTYGEPISIPLMLTHNLPLKARQQFFSDINNNVSKPSAAINMAYDGRNDVAQGMVSFLSRHDTFAEVTDFEHNVVPAKSKLWVSFKALSDATAKFASVGSKTLEMGDIESIWEAWLSLTQIEAIRHGTSQADYKRDYIQFHAVMINAFGYAVQRLMDEHSIVDIVQMIEELSNNAGSSEMEDFFLISRWGGICVNAEKERPTIIASIPAQKAAAELLVQIIQAKKLKVSA
ncbi:TPA: DGQHR domain-containing protein [Klebsiella pneumoniae]|nr:DGQHR domain-containing protein [Klebsiella pneumoniae]HCB0712758.1 DGQHR domain-containing protein [Klebsiella pneumoniae]